MKVLFNYAHLKFYQSQKLQTKTGYEIGGFDKVFSYGFKDIDSEFYKKNKRILDEKVMAGCGLWKFYFAKRLLEDNTIPEGSYIFYADSGSKFIHSIDPLIEAVDRDNLSIMTFRMNHQCYVWTKRDIFILTGTDEPKYTHSGTRCGGHWLLRKNDESRKFIEQCYTYGQDYRIITNAPNEMGFDNYPGFISNRSYCEAIITAVSKKWSLYPYRVPTQWGFKGDVDFTDNIYGKVGLKRMIEKFGSLSEWPKKYKITFHGESLNHYPELTVDTKSTYPTILYLHKDPH